MVTRPLSAARIATGLGRSLPLVGSYLTHVGAILGRGHRDGEVIATAPGLAPRTPFNDEVTLHRRFAMRSVDLDDVKTVKNAFGMSVNDVVMAMSAGALRHWLIDHDALPEAPLVAMIPVSVRDEASKSKMGNKVSAMLASLPTHLDDPDAASPQCTRRRRSRRPNRRRSRRTRRERHGFRTARAGGSSRPRCVRDGPAAPDPAF